MYKKFNSARRGFDRGFKRRNFAGPRRMKFFDPTELVGMVNNTVSEKETLVVNKFSDFKIAPQLLKNIMEHRYTTPTPIQDKAIPAILEGRDVIGMANTGTGKTAAFLIPLINKVLNDRYQKVLIVTPTRELAVQIRDEFFKFSKGLGIFSALCIGGTNMNRQRNDLQRNSHFVIGTPGRLTDMVKNGYIRLSEYNSVVLDEADHMVDIGFISDIRYFISLLPQDRHALFFSATIDGKVREILNSFVKNPVMVSVKSNDMPSNIEHQIIRITDSINKTDKLIDMLDSKEMDKVLVFGRTKHGVQKLSDQLSKIGFKSGAIHGNKRQSQRIKVLDNFKRNNLNILVATDVAARGLDIPNVSHVINFDLPETRQAYTHRIGRTGRAGKPGFALTFV